ncbi:putative LRX2 [Rhodotorula toruloides ATCC 204091]|uniref:BY PROTMAP: gi/342319147/gb/EGU11097.1/ putative LRX2 [Rhodotorula glutinis ATCC 204091] n=1 Tax=Rhodotorula toruloides TaxID=5286 RepID=A0A0K3CLP4_RHOTO|nr:putative LRX2 [Rhodotorula toruloides ATCC 204091]
MWDQMPLVDSESRKEGAGSSWRRVARIGESGDSPTRTMSEVDRAEAPVDGVESMRTAMYDPKSAPALLDGNARTLLTAPASPTLLQRLDNLVLRLICPRNAMHDKPGQGERGGGCETGIGGC